MRAREARLGWCADLYIAASSTRALAYTRGFGLLFPTTLTEVVEYAPCSLALPTGCTDLISSR